MCTDSNWLFWMAAALGRAKETWPQQNVEQSPDRKHYIAAALTGP